MVLVLLIGKEVRHDKRSRYDASQGPRIIGPRDGKALDFGIVGVRFLVWGEESGGGFSLVEHPIRPRCLAAPLHRHSREDEYSYVLEGRLGAQLGDEVVYAEAGDLVFKPCEQWHTFWNAGDGPCRILEIISPAGFEHYFEEFAGGVGSPEESQVRYGTQVDLDRTRRLCEQYGLQFPIME
jgi:mannose-6-phosphate isomerase-like protein (cupin superfamily)